MPRLATAIALACLAGCVSLTPSEVVTSGNRHEYSSSLGAHQAAVCMTRNGQSEGKLYAATLSELPAKDSYEVSIAAPGLAKGAILVVHTAPLSAGSRLEFFISPRTVERDEQYWIERLRKGC